MNWLFDRRVSAAPRGASLWVASLVSMVAACGGTPDPQQVEVDDEYTQPLTNAVIASPSGTKVIGPAPAPLPPSSGASRGGSSGSEAASGAPRGGSSGSVASSGFVSSGAASSGFVSSGFSSSGFGSSGFGSSGAGEGSGSEISSGSPFASGSEDAGTGSAGGFGLWHFDDCSPKSHFLVDASGAGANAQQALKADCVAGISGLGVQLRSVKDVITVPDEPQFSISATNRIAVAAWVNPKTVSGDQPIVIKRLNDKTAFSLGIHNGNIEMSIVLKSGTTYISQAPIPAGTWSHVAGMFDGTFLYLFLDGQQYGQVYAAGDIRDVFAPILIGATTGTQYLHGVVDEVFVSTQDISKDQLTALSCLSNPPSVAVNPAVGGPATFDTDVHYDVDVTNNDIGFCQDSQIQAFMTGFNPDINAFFDNGFDSDAPPGQTVDFGAEVTADDNVTPGTIQIPFVVERFGPNFDFVQSQLTLDLVPPSGCFVSTPRELMILDTSVVDDPVRTFGVPNGSTGGGDAGIFSAVDGGEVALDASIPVSSGAVTSGAAEGDGGSSPSLGVWTFGHLMTDLAPTPDQAAAMTEDLFDNWLSDQTVNGFTVSARPAIQQLLLDIWPRTASGALDLTQAPLRLQAIVSRVDLRNLASGSAGEGRFVFAVDDATGLPQQFTVILEYNLPAQTQQDVLNWANRWHNLSSLPFPSEQYNAALEAVTRSFAGRGAGPAGTVNGNNLVSLRTNEIALSFGQRWELREFNLSPATGFLQEGTVKETPDLGFNETPALATFVNQNAAAIVAEVPGANDNTVPTTFQGSPFLAGSVFNDLIEWGAPGIADDNARFHMSINTCNGCHGPDTNTGFLQISPRFPGAQATLSPFLTGTTVTDSAGVTQTLNDLARRRTDLMSLVCTDAGAPPAPAPTPPSSGAEASSGAPLK